MQRWGKWYLETAKFNGVRLDAIKHISPRFIIEWIDYMRSLKPDLFIVGEYWAPGFLPLLKKYLDATEGRLLLFDASLHHNIYDADKNERNYDLTQIFKESLVEEVPLLSVTIIDNHDTQPLQALEALVDQWFKPIAYALILLREKGYPCIFYPDLYGTSYVDKGKDGNDYEIILPKVDELENLLIARKDFAFGIQRDYFDHPNCVGWTREGLDEIGNKSGCAVVISNGEDGFKFMEIGKQHTGKTFYDFVGNHDEEILIDENCWGEFKVRGGKVSVWVRK